jgi:uncharacterized membrane protein
MAAFLALQAGFDHRMFRTLFPIDPRPASRPAPPDRGADVIFVCVLTLGYAAIMYVKLDLWRHNVLISDWTFMQNILWNTDLRIGQVLYSEIRFRDFGYPSYLNEHFSPLLIPIATLYRAVPFGDLMLLLLHGACPALVALSLRGIGLALFADRKLAALMAIAFAFNPAVLQPTVDSVYGFHSDSLSPPLLALAAWAFVTGRWRTYWVAVLAALLVKENIPAYGAIFGGVLLFSPRYRKTGLATLALSVTIFLIGSRGLPMMTGFTNRNVGYAEQFVRDLVSLHPAFDYSREEFLYALRYGGAFLPVLAMWPFLALPMPDLLVIGQIQHAHLTSWHVLPTLATLGVLATIGSHQIVRRNWLSARTVRFYWITVAAAALLLAPVDLFIKHRRLVQMGSNVDQSAIAEAVALIPADAHVATTTDLEQYLSHRRVIFTTLHQPDIDYVVLNAGALSENRAEAIRNVYEGDLALTRTMDEKLRQHTASLMFDARGIRVLRLGR